MERLCLRIDLSDVANAECPRRWHDDWRKWRPAEMTSFPWKFRTSRPCGDRARRKLEANRDIRLWTDFPADLEVQWNLIITKSVLMN